jgi:hypothetical protein
MLGGLVTRQTYVILQIVTTEACVNTAEILVAVCSKLSLANFLSNKIFWWRVLANGGSDWGLLMPSIADAQISLNVCLT